MITGAGCLSCVADTSAGLHAALSAGESGLKPIELFSTESIGCHQGGEIRPFDAQAYLPDRNLRPIDRTSRLLLVAAGQALAGSGLGAAPAARNETEIGLVLGTTFCSLRTIAEFDRRNLQLGASHASPLDFANSVINAAAGQTAIWYGLRGLNSTISAGAASGLAAVGYGVDQIRGGRAAALLAGGAEELCFESFFGHYQAGRLCAGSEVGGEFPIPFDVRRNGFALAEGAALVVLEDAEAASGRGAAVLAEVLGHGSGFDPLGTEASAVRAVARAVRIALDDAGLAAGDVDAWSAGANGSVDGDRREALGVAAALGERAADLPVTAVKSMLGEALGASGGLQIVALLGTFADGVLPGVARLERTEEGFPMPAAGPAARQVRVRRALVTSLSADGHAWAVVLGAAA
ncbi:MAG TPA: beta-ketoacyl synthase N-terminal-like domain-containing protein [Candidatus Dormibacteraeota bacterium]